MILTDTGPLVALLNKNDANHKICIQALDRLPAEPLLTTWPCFTETMYLIFRAGGYQAQAELWRWRKDLKLKLHTSTEKELDSMTTLMNTYHDRPMDLADASIVAAAEHLKKKYVFTLDSDFYIYRLSDNSTLECIP